MQTPEELVARIERAEGVLNIYERDVEAEFTPALMERLKRGRQDHFREMSADFADIDIDASGYAESIYRPRFITVAREISQILMGNDWECVKDILVAPVSIPVFNAAAVKARDGATAIIVHSPMFTFLPLINGLIWEAATSADDKNWDRLTELRIQMDFHITALLDMTKTDFALLYKFPGVNEYKISHDLQRVQSTFVLLHEYAHVVCGHLGEVELALT